MLQQTQTVKGRIIPLIVLSLQVMMSFTDNCSFHVAYMQTHEKYGLHTISHSGNNQSNFYRLGPTMVCLDRGKGDEAHCWIPYIGAITVARIPGSCPDRYQYFDEFQGICIPSTHYGQRRKLRRRWDFLELGDQVGNIWE